MDYMDILELRDVLAFLITAIATGLNFVVVRVRVRIGPKIQKRKTI